MREAMKFGRMVRKLTTRLGIKNRVVCLNLLGIEAAVRIDTLVSKTISNL